MLIATFGPSTTWVGKSLTFEGGQFILEDHGPVLRDAVAKYENQGHLQWVSEGVRLWFLSRSDTPPGGQLQQGNKSDVGGFRSAYPMAIVMDVVCAGIRGELSSGEAVQSEPGVLASIYVSELKEDRVVVTAGNVIEAYWSFVVELTAVADGTRGHAYYDRPLVGDTMWYKNAWELAIGVERLLKSASASVKSWNFGGSKK